MKAAATFRAATVRERCPVYVKILFMEAGFL
jgi:hypothetical protein